MYKKNHAFSDSMNTSAFWSNNIDNSDELIMNLDNIKKFNLRINSKISSLCSLQTEEKAISSGNLIQYVNFYNIPAKDMYDSKGSLVTKDFYKKIIDNRNLDKIKEMNPVRYGISVKKISIRSFPTEDAVFSSPEHSKLNNFDRFQETGCPACEPLLILHESKDKKWYFVKMYNYIGWAKSDGIALAEDKNEIFDYAFSKDFLIVTGKEVFFTPYKKGCPAQDIKCGMGTRLCLLNDESIFKENYIIKYPVRNEKGKLIFKKAFINKNEDISKGYLPYTTHNIINQAFKFLNSTYDWGEKFDNKDCSSFILTIFKCFGFLLPRNADEQEKSFLSADNVITFNKEDTLEQRYYKMDKLKPAAALFMNGHTMLYLGKYEGTHYMIHTFAGYSVKKGDSFEAKMALCTAVSSVNLLTSSGTPFIEKFTSSVYYSL